MDKANWVQRCQWFKSTLGQLLIEIEAMELTRKLPKLRVGRFGLLFHDQPIFSGVFNPRIKDLLLVTKASSQDSPAFSVISDAENLPLLDNSVSLVMLPHVLELVEDPKQTIEEAVNVLTGEGLIIITGFNPFSLWGIRRLFAHKTMPGLGRFISANRVRRWLRDNDCECLSTRTVFYRFPSRSYRWLRATRFLEVLGRFCWPGLGGAYVIIAQKRMLPLMPIKERWRVKELLVAKGVKGVVEPTRRSQS